MFFFFPERAQRGRDFRGHSLGPSEAAGSVAAGALAADDDGGDAGLPRGGLGGGPTRKSDAPGTGRGGREARGAGTGSSSRGQTPRCPLVPLTPRPAGSLRPRPDPVPHAPPNTPRRPPSLTPHSAPSAEASRVPD